MSLKLKDIEYHYMGRNRDSSAKATVTDGQKDFSGEGKSKHTINEAIWKAVTKALCPLDIIDMEKVKDLQVLSGQKPGELFIVGLYDGEEITGHSINEDRHLATAEALVDFYGKLRAEK